MIVGNHLAWQSVRDWLAATRATVSVKVTSWEGCLILLGGSGIGKTHTLHALIAESGHDLVAIHDAQTAKDLKDQITKAASTRLIDQVENMRRERKVLVIDDLDVLFASDRMMASALTDMLHSKSRLPYIPVVLVGSDACARKLGTAMMAKCTVVYMKPPASGEIAEFLKGLGVTDAVHAEQCAAACNGNISQALHLLATVTPNGCVDANIAFTDVFSTPSFEGNVRILEEDPWINPLRVHENFPRELAQRTGAAGKKTTAYTRFLSAMCHWDLWMPSSSAVAIDYLAATITHVLTQLPRKRAATNVGLDEFTKLFSNMSLQKKYERAAYGNFLK